MPFKVTPSESVDIDLSDAGPDDALRIVTLPNATLFCGVREVEGVSGTRKELVLIPGAVPPFIEEAATLAAVEFIDKASTDRDKTFEHWFERQPDANQGLLAVITDRILKRATVCGGTSYSDPLDIGTPLIVHFRGSTIVSDRVDNRLERDATWHAKGTVIKLEPVTRFEAIRWVATRQ